MANKLDIYNWALIRIGEQTIEDENERSASAELLRYIYDLTRQSLMRSYPWNFCQDTAELTQIADEEPPDYLYVYQLPSDCLFPTKLVAQNTDVVSEWDYEQMRYIGENDEWEIRRDNKLYSNVSGLIIKYTVDHKDESKWDELFVDAMAWRLASEIAMQITKNEEVRAQCARAFINTMAHARGMQGAEGQKRLRIAREWVGAHRGRMRRG